jgi:hypothetical protein
MPEELKDDQEITEIQESVDLDNSDSRMTFLKSQLNDLLDGINSSYGQELMEELLIRLEKTIEDYNVEVSKLMGKLKSGKIFEEDTPDEDSGFGDHSLEDDFAAEDEASESNFDDQEAEDADIIARMRKRINHD